MLMNWFFERELNLLLAILWRLHHKLCGNMVMHEEGAIYSTSNHVQPYIIILI